MSKIDHFESAFRSSIRIQYQPRAYPIRDILVVTDLSAEEDVEFLTQLEPLFSGVTPLPRLTLLPKEQSESLPNLIAEVKSQNPDLICTYRNIHTNHGQYPYTIGDHVEVLTQITSTPILLLPRPEKIQGINFKCPTRIMAITDHFAQSPELVDAAVALIQPTGHLILGHVEDDITFERYLTLISKIPEIDTEVARDKIKDQIIKDAQKYIESCQESIQKHQPQLQVYSEVQMGHHLQTYVALIEEHQVDLLIMNTKDDDQLAMHGLSYPLAIELSHLPLLML